MKSNLENMDANPRDSTNVIGALIKRTNPVTSTNPLVELAEAQMLLKDKDMQIMELQIKYESLRSHQQGTNLAVQTAVNSVKEGYEIALEKLSSELSAFQGATPQEVTQLRLQNAALIAEKGDLEKRFTLASEHIEGIARETRKMMAEWEVEKKALENQGTTLSDTLRSRQEVIEQLYQENESLKARIKVFETRTAEENPELCELQLELNAANLKISELGNALREKTKEAASALTEMERELYTTKDRMMEYHNEMHMVKKWHVEEKDARCDLQGKYDDIQDELTCCKDEIKMLTEQSNTWKDKANAMEANIKSIKESSTSAASGTVRLAERRMQQAEHRAAVAQQQAEAASLKVVQLEQALKDSKRDARVIGELRDALRAKVAETAVLQDRLRRYTALVDDVGNGKYIGEGQKMKERLIPAYQVYN